MLSIGIPTANNTVYILNEELKACAIGEIGEMWAGGDCVSAGYIANDELNADRYRPDPFLVGRKMFRTRDLGRWTIDGELEHFGRTDDQVKIRGFRVELDSVSNILESAPGCKQAVTLKLNDRNLVAFVSPKSVDIELAKKAVAEKLPYYCTPAMIIALDELPVTSRGKIDKRLLTAMAVERQDLADHHKVILPEVKSLFLKLSKNPLLMPYNRLAIGMMLINFLIFLNGVSASAISNLVVLNFLIANLIRQHDVINLLFKMVTGAPKTWPLSVRWAFAKVYHFGGVAVGTYFSGAVWLTVLLSTADFSAGVRLIIFTNIAILAFVMTMSLPKIRAKYHDEFEIVARFGNWSSLYLFWIQSYLLIRGHQMRLPDVLQISVLLLITFCTALPWLRMRRVKVDINTPSSHAAIANFTYGVTPFAGSSTEISRSPLYEWHSFANIPSPQTDGFRLTISRAGDWTSKLIDQKPSHVWVKGIPTAGVGNVEKLFSKVVWVATGSGIGPCLPHLLKNEVPSLLVWSTKSPRKTYGDKLVDEILKAQPNAIIWDTDLFGKPDLVKLAYQAVKNSGAEAVICIANKKVTWQVNEALETRGIPSLGAIWDS